MFVLTFPELGVLNARRLATPESAILAAMIFHALIEQAVSSFLRKGNLSTLRELALRAAADEVARGR